MNRWVLVLVGIALLLGQSPGLTGLTGAAAIGGASAIPLTGDLSGVPSTTQTTDFVGDKVSVDTAVVIGTVVAHVAAASKP